VKRRITSVKIPDLKTVANPREGTSLRSMGKEKEGGYGGRVSHGGERKKAP